MNSAPGVHRVALLGFGDFERSALVSYLRLSGSRVPAYCQAASLASADYVIADADHAGTLDTVLGADRVADTVFIGSLAPEGALAWMMRPIDPLQVFREIDAAAAVRRARAQTPPSAGSPLPTLTEAVFPAPASPQRAVPAPAEHDASRRAGETITPAAALLVDDGDIALRSLERQLQALGLRIETAANSQRALELLTQRRYDMVFIDVELGPRSELDGLALCKHIKRQQHQPATGDVPMVVMVSTHAATTDRVRGSFAGCDAFLAKPIDDDALRRSLRKLGLRLSAPGDPGNSRPGALSGRPLPPDRSH